MPKQISDIIQQEKGVQYMLEGFEKISIFSGRSFLSVTSNGLTFNKSAVQQLGTPKRVVFLLNSVQKKLAVQVCDDISDNDAIAFCQEEKIYENGLRINNRGLQQKLSGMMGWDLEERNYRIDGTYFDEDRAMIFDMNLARAFKKRNRNNAKG